MVVKTITNIMIINENKRKKQISNKSLSVTVKRTINYEKINYEDKLY